jgi:nucleoid-associated protein YgaU
MGVFSFLKNAGAKLFKRKSDKTDPATLEAVREENKKAMMDAVADLGIELNDFYIQLQEDTVIAFGEATSQADKEKVILVLGNTEGIAKVDDRMTVAKPEPEAKFYEVKKGDSLSKIAKEFYGDAMKYPVIFDANKPMLKDPNLIYPGQMLRIPPVED